jgi:hypothetical protein
LQGLFRPAARVVDGKITAVVDGKITMAVEGKVIGHR